MLSAIAVLLAYFWFDWSSPDTTRATRNVSNEIAGDSIRTMSAADSGDVEVSAAVIDSSAEPRTDTTATRAAIQPERRPLVTRPVRIQLLNGTTEKGLARRVSPRLRAMGFDIREVGNSGQRDTRECELIDRSGADSLGLILADSVRLPRSLVKHELNSAMVDIDVTLILGRDYRNYELAAGR